MTHTPSSNTINLSFDFSSPPSRHRSKTTSSQQQIPTQTSTHQHAIFQMYQDDEMQNSPIRSSSASEHHILTHFTSSMHQKNPRKRPRISSPEGDTNEPDTRDSSLLIESLHEQVVHHSEQAQEMMIQQQAHEGTITTQQRQIDELKRVLHEERERFGEKVREVENRERGQSEKVVGELRQQVEMLQRDLGHLEERSAQDKATIARLEEKCSQLMKENHEVNAKVVKMLNEGQTTSATSAAPSQKDKDYRIESLEQKLHTTQLEVERLQRERQSLQEHTVLKSQLSSELEELTDLRRKMKSLQTQNEQFRRESQNILILKEENRKLNQQLDENHNRDAEILQFLNEYDTLKVKMSQWEDTFGSNEASEACHFMKILQEENQDLIAEREKLRVQNESYQDTVKSLNDEVEKLTKQLFSQENQLTAHRATIEKQRNQIFLLEQEKDSTTEVLKSYDRDQDDANQKRILDLETQLQALHQRYTDVEKQRDSLEKSKQDALVDQRKMFMEEVSRLKQNFQEQQHQKIVHLRLNPQVEASTKSTNELVRLRSQVKVLEERLRQTTVSEHTSHLLAQKQEEFAKRIQRHNEVFREKISEFRRAMYLLCGYRVDVLDDHQYKLSSMFAEHKDDFLLFHFEQETKKMNLIETPFAVSLQHEEEAMRYLRHMNSIPGFTAQVTLDLMSKQTIFPQMSK